MGMLSRIVLVAPLVLAGLARAQVDPEAKAVIERAQNAWLELDGLAAKVTMDGTGAIGAMAAPKVDASLLMLRDPNNPGFWLRRSTGEGSIAGQEQATRFDAAWNPEADRVSWIDHEGKVLHRAPRGSGTAFTLASAAVPAELLAAVPFAEELRAPVLSLEDPAEVGGVLCDVVRVEYANGMTVARWSIGREDALPRRHETLFEQGQLQGSIVRTMSGLEVDPPLSVVAFEVDQPEGYGLEEVEPARVQRPPVDMEVAQATSTARRASGRDAAPDFSLLDPEGVSVALSEYRGRLVLLDFWGTWCLPCKKATPFLQALHEDYAEKGVQVFGLACRERDRAAPIEYFEKNNLGYMLLLDADEVAKEYGVRAYPTYVLIDADGGKLAEWVGGNPEETFKEIREKIDQELTRMQDMDLMRAAEQAPEEE